MANQKFYFNGRNTKCVMRTKKQLMKNENFNDRHIPHIMTTDSGGHILGLKIIINFTFC